jgi:hypothetical protein
MEHHYGHNMDPDLVAFAKVEHERQDFDRRRPLGTPRWNPFEQVRVPLSA